MGRGQGAAMWQGPWEARVAWALLSAWLLTLWLLGTGPLSLGAHRWDDFHYVSAALDPAFDPSIRNRYVHVWGLRLFLSVFDDRVAGTIAYAVAIHLGLTATAFALGRRIHGTLCGLLAAALLPLLPPVLQFLSTPMPDAPSALYAGLALLVALGPTGGHTRGTPWRSTAAGLLCFLSLKSKETGIAVVPAVAFLLLRSGAGLRATVGGLVSGALAGQVGLSLADWVLVGDPLAGLRPQHHDAYAKVLSSAPRRSHRIPNRMRAEWMELLLSRDMRDFALCALLGTLLGMRDRFRGRMRGAAAGSGDAEANAETDPQPNAHAAANTRPKAHAAANTQTDATRADGNAALAAWGVLGLCFNAWVSWRYAGIDGQLRYFSMLALPLSVGCGALLQGLLRGAPLPAAPPDPGSPPPPPRDTWPYLLGALAVGWVAYRGLRASIAVGLLGSDDFAEQRGYYFLTPLVVVSALFIALSTRHTMLRRCAALAIAASLALCAWPAARDVRTRARAELAGWRALVTHMQRRGVTHLTRYKVNHRALDKTLVAWRLRALGPFEAVSQAYVGQPGKLPRDSLLITFPRLRGAAEHAGLRHLLDLSRDRGRYVVMAWPDSDPAGHSRSAGGAAAPPSVPN